uniref:Transmembrane protein n=1 Tax=Trepomonas sp. PC1 TaxID=1076344 RepID=A0A146K1R2_9EUKA|eukprot:JAP89459.1 Hypothetical protein TPC1_31046 [Trepomonas sp. PC1]
MFLVVLMLQFIGWSQSFKSKAKFTQIVLTPAITWSQLHILFCSFKIQVSPPAGQSAICSHIIVKFTTTFCFLGWHSGYCQQIVVVLLEVALNTLQKSMSHSKSSQNLSWQQNQTSQLISINLISLVPLYAAHCFLEFVRFHKTQIHFIKNALFLLKLFPQVFEFYFSFVFSPWFRLNIRNFIWTDFLAFQIVSQKVVHFELDEDVNHVRFFLLGDPKLLFKAGFLGYQILLVQRSVKGLFGLLRDFKLVYGSLGCKELNLLTLEQLKEVARQIARLMFEDFVLYELLMLLEALQFRFQVIYFLILLFWNLFIVYKFLSWLERRILAQQFLQINIF